MNTAAKAARVGTFLTTVLCEGALLMLFMVGGYMLWYGVSTYLSTFLDDDLLKYKPTLDGGDNPSLKELMAINPDVCAWITVEGTNIDYPVVRGHDNQEYLSKDVYGEYSLAGSIFLDKKNRRDFTNPYNILYGHHFDGGAVFGQVVDFLEDDFFTDHPTGILFLPDNTYAISFFSANEENAYESTVLDANKKRNDMAPVLSYIKDKSKQYRKLSPALSAEDTIIALVTCEDAFTDGRAIVFGRLDEISYVEQGTKEDLPQAQEWFENLGE